MLLLRASRRLKGRLVALLGSSIARLDREYFDFGTDALGGVSIATGEDMMLGASCFPSHKARQRSVKLRHIMSALRRMWRSETVTPLMMDAAEKVVPCGPALPVIATSCTASLAVASSVRYKDALSRAFAFPRAICKVGCMSANVTEVGVGGFDAPATASWLALRSCFGEELIVVGAVVAVLGLSELAPPPVTAALEVDGILPVSSSFLIRDFRSSSSSHTVEGAVCESTESDSAADCLASELLAGESPSEPCGLADWLPCRLVWDAAEG
jgi:hypothetical protein